MKLEFGNLQSKSDAEQQGKREAAVHKALSAIRNVCAAAGNERFFGRCPFCHKIPYETQDDSFPCSHKNLYEITLRGYGLDVLNEAARRFLGVKSNGND